MATTSEPPTPPHRSWRWYIGRTLAALIIVALLVSSWMLYMGISTSLRAEENLHATLFTIQLVEQFVYEHGRWPKSWTELEQVRFPGAAPSPLNGGSHGYDWPAQSPQLQERVVVDFAADVNTIINQNPAHFQAIKPNGPYYEYREYGFIDSLQETLKNAAANGPPISPSK